MFSWSQHGISGWDGPLWWRGHSWAGWESVGQVLELRLARWGIKTGKTDSQLLLALWFVFHCMLFVLCYKGESPPKCWEVLFLSQWRWERFQTLQDIGKWWKLFQLSSSCNFPQVPHLFCCRSAYLTLVFCIENYANKTICCWKLLLLIAWWRKGKAGIQKLETQQPCPFLLTSLSSVYKLVCQIGHSSQFSRQLFSKVNTFLYIIFFVYIFSINQINLLLLQGFKSFRTSAGDR